MRLAYKFKLKNDPRLRRLCEVSKNLYNQALYLLKHELKENNKWLGYNQLNEILQKTTNIEGEINYRLLKAQVAQQCLRTLDKNVKSYIKSVKGYAKDKTRYSGRPNFPKYKESVNQIIYTNQSCSIKDGYLNLSKDLKLRIPQYGKYGERLKQFQQARVIPDLDGSFTVEIVYLHDNSENTDLDYGRYASVDLGVDNLATLVLPDDSPILFNGRQVKAKNQYFNKETARLKSELGEGRRSSARIRALCARRERQMTDIFHKITRRMVNLLVEGKVGNIVVGYNKGWKDSINIGKRNNQTFVDIPYQRLIECLRYKCEMCGIRMTISEERYTSKCDALATEPIGKHEEYLGKRVKRGLFQSSTGKLVNADVNGALNIMRKVVGDSECVTRIIDSGRLFRPVRVNVL